MTFPTASPKQPAKLSKHMFQHCSPYYQVFIYFIPFPPSVLRLA